MISASACSSPVSSRALALLRATWVDHVTTDLDATVRPGEVFVLRERGELRCGVQVVERRILGHRAPGPVGQGDPRAAGLIAKLSPLFVLRDRHFALGGQLLSSPAPRLLVGPLLQAVQRRLRLAGRLVLRPASPALGEPAARARVRPAGVARARHAARDPARRQTPRRRSWRRSPASHGCSRRPTSSEAPELSPTL